MKKADILSAKANNVDLAIQQHSWSNGRERGQVVEEVPYPRRFDTGRINALITRLRADYPDVSFWVRHTGSAQTAWVVRIVDNPKHVEYVVCSSRHIDSTWVVHEARQAQLRLYEQQRRDARAQRWIEYDELIDTIQNGPHSELFTFPETTHEWRLVNNPPTNVTVALEEVAKHS